MPTLDETLKKYKDFINRDMPKHYFRSSLLSFNALIGDMRGFKGGRIVQILGDAKTGKSSICFDIISNAQKDGYMCAYFDVERTMEDPHARMHGVDIDSLLKIKTDTAEQGFDIVEALVQSGEVKVIVVDSIPMLQPSLELEKNFTDNEKMGGNALILTRFLKRMTPMADNHGALVLLVNQYRANFSSMPAAKKYKPYGPNIFEYGNAFTVELTRIENKEKYATIQAFVEKNKLSGTERQKTTYKLIHGEGFDVVEDLVTLAIDYDVIVMRGKGHYYYEELHAHGIDNCKELFPLDEIKAKVIEAYERHHK